MNKNEWDAIPLRERDKLVAETIMGLVVCNSRAAVEISNANIPTDLDRLATWSPWNGWYAQDLYVVEEPFPSTGFERVDEYTTDRNACALVLDEIEKRGKYESLISLLVKYRPEDQDQDGCTFCDVWFGLRADPDTICYCAVKAVSDV